MVAYLGSAVNNLNLFVIDIVAIIKWNYMSFVESLSKACASPPFYADVYMCSVYETFCYIKLFLKHPKIGEN